jgi:hypothetical protein
VALKFSDGCRPFMIWYSRRARRLLKSVRFPPAPANASKASSDGASTIHHQHNQLQKMYAILV